MEKFIRVIIPDTESVPDHAPVLIKESISNRLVESDSPTKLAITEGNELVIHVGLQAHLSESESDQCAERISDVLVEAGVDNFDIEISTGIPLYESSMDAEPQEEKPESVDIFTKTDYDVVNDLVVYMRNDFNFYRRHYYPAIHKIAKVYQKTKRLDFRKFMEPVIKYGVLEYCKQYDLPESPDELFDKESREAVLSRIISEESADIKSNNYS